MTAAFVAGVAAAQTAVPAAPPGPPMHAPTFEDLDANHDGVVSKAEFDAWRAAHAMHEGRGGPGMRHMEMHHMHDGPPIDFAAADTDHDGKISWAEFQAAAEKHLKAHFDRLDTNHDGFLDKDELPGRDEKDAPPPPPAN